MFLLHLSLGTIQCRRLQVESTATDRNQIQIYKVHYNCFADLHYYVIKLKRNYIITNLIGWDKNSDLFNKVQIPKHEIL